MSLTKRVEAEIRQRLKQKGMGFEYKCDVINLLGEIDRLRALIAQLPEGETSLVRQPSAGDVYEREGHPSKKVSDPGVLTVFRFVAFDDGRRLNHYDLVGLGNWKLRLRSKQKRRSVENLITDLRKHR